MRITVGNSFWIFAIALVTFSGDANAFPMPTMAVPGPLAGVGLPVVAVGAGLYWLIRKLRNK